MRFTQTNVLIFGLLTILLYTCKNKETVSPSLTTIKFELQDDESNKVSGANVYLFTELSDWQQSKLARKPFNAKDSTTSENGNASINIDPSLDAYLLVIYKEPLRKVTLLNVAYDSIITKLPKNIDITVLIKLQAVDGNLGFYTNDQQLLSPIKITLQDKESYSLNTRRDASPVYASDAGQIAINLPPGTYTYQATNANGCSWAGKQTLTIGGFNKINLSGCNSGEVAFYCEDPNLARFPITVTINEESTSPFGSIVSPVTNYQTGGPITSSFLTTYLSVGKYTYSAQSQDSKCLWTGKFEVTANQANSLVVRLGVCK